MMDLCNNEQRARFLGNPSQMFGVTRMVVDEGKAKGDTVYAVQSGGGLAYTVTADTGLDIGDLTYRGVNVRYLTKNGHMAGRAFQHFENDFASTFPGGMLYTCGLTSSGGGCRDENGVYYPTHGRYHATPAEQCASGVHDNVVSVSGLVRETAFSGHVLELQRTVSTPVGSARLEITDVLTNSTPETAAYMLLYHFNFGYPFLDKDLRLEFPDGTEIISHPSNIPANDCVLLSNPVDGREEELFLHRIPSNDGMARVRLLNAKLGFGVEVSWSADTLPLMLQWKCMRSGEYVLGIEPTATPSRGRVEEQRERTIAKLAPFEKKTMRVSLQFFDL